MAVVEEIIEQICGWECQHVVSTATITPTNPNQNMNNKQQENHIGGNRHRVTKCYSRMRLDISSHASTCLFTAHELHPCFSHSSFSPPFHHATSCPTKHRADVMGSARRSSDRKRALHNPPPRAGRTPLTIKGTKRGAGLGFSMEYGESPQKIGMWGRETSRGKGRRDSRCRLSAFHNLHKYSLESFSLSL
jgi:hypothetical protein